MFDKKEPILLSEEPADEGKLALYILLLQGLGNLFPWNAFITASSYFSARFCDSSYETNFENYFSLSFTSCQTVGLAFAILYAHNFSFESLITYPLICYASIFAVTTVMVLITISANPLFALTLTSTCLCGLVAASLSSGLFGMAAKFPTAYTGSIMTGQGLAGLVVSISSLVATFASPSTLSCDDDSDTDESACSDSINFGAFAYFLVSTLVLIACIFGYLAFRKLPFARYHLEDQHNDYESLDSSESRSTNNLSSQLLVSDVQSPLYQSDNINTKEGLSVQTSSRSVNDSEFTMNKATILSVLSRIYPMALSVWFVFTVTIGIFPSLTVLIQSTEQCKTSNRFQNDLFVPLLFLIFNLFDFIGRFAAGHYKLIINKKNIWIASVARIIFFPAFLLCNNAGTRLPVLFNNDVCPIIFMILFALSNGYVSTACMITGPTLVSKKESSLVGTIMIFSLTFGLLSGALVSFLVVYISRGYV